MFPEKIYVRAKEDVSYYTQEKGVRKNLICEVKEGEILELFLCKETEEYFLENKKLNKQVLIGEIDRHDCLVLKPEFDLYLGKYF